MLQVDISLPEIEELHKLVADGQDVRADDLGRVGHGIALEDAVGVVRSGRSQAVLRQGTVDVVAHDRH